MASHTTKTAFTIPCTQEQAELIGDAIIELEKLSDVDAIEELRAKEHLTVIESAMLSLFDSLCEHVELQEDDPTFVFEFGIEHVADGFFITPNCETINTDFCVALAQAVLKHFDSDECVSFEAARSCSNHSVDGFGGHACFITKDKVLRNNTNHPIQLSQEAHNNKERFYFCSLVEVCDEFESTTRFLMKIVGDECPTETLAKIQLEFRDGGERDDNSDGFVIYSDDSGTKKANHTEITAVEYDVMRHYLKTLAPHNKEFAKAA